MAKIGSARIDLLRPDFEQSNTMLLNSIDNAVKAADPLQKAIASNYGYLQEQALGQLKDTAKQLVPQNPNDPVALQEYMQGLQSKAEELNANRLGINANTINEVTNLGINNSQNTLKEYLANQGSSLGNQAQDYKNREEKGRLRNNWASNIAMMAETPEERERIFHALSDPYTNYSDTVGYLGERQDKAIDRHLKHLSGISPVINALNGATNADYTLGIAQNALKQGYSQQEYVTGALENLINGIGGNSGSSSVKGSAPVGSSSYSNSSAGANSGSGGFGALVQSGESGEASYNAVNYGSNAGSGTVDASSMTVGQVVQQMKAGKIAAFGRYQFNVGSFPEAVQKLGIDPNTRMTPQVQDQIFSTWYAGGKRPDIMNYITGKSNNIDRAITAASAEWRALQNVDGKIYKADGHNNATIGPKQTAASLNLSRKAYQAARSKGMSHEQAYSTALLKPETVLGKQAINNYQQRTGAPGTTSYSSDKYKVSEWDKEVSGKALQSRLKIKQNESVSNGVVKGRTAEFAEILQNYLGDNLKYFSSFNDKFHAGSNSYHTTGEAFDLVLKDGTSKKQAAHTANLIKQMAAEAGYEIRILDEYNDPSEHSTGGHIHVTVAGKTKPGTYAGSNNLEGLIPPNLQAKQINPDALDKLYDLARQNPALVKDHINKTLEIAGTDPTSLGFGVSGAFATGMPSVNYADSANALQQLSQQTFAKDTGLTNLIKEELPNTVNIINDRVRKMIDEDILQSEQYISDYQAAVEAAQASGANFMNVSNFVDDMDKFKSWLVKEGGVSEEAWNSLPPDYQFSLMQAYNKDEESIKQTKAVRSANEQKLMQSYVRPKAKDATKDLNTIVGIHSGKLATELLSDLGEVDNGWFTSKNDAIAKEKNNINRFLNVFNKEFMMTYKSVRKAKYMTRADVEAAMDQALKAYKTEAKLIGKKPWETINEDNRSELISVMNKHIRHALIRQAASAAERHNEKLDIAVTAPKLASSVIENKTLDDVQKLMNP